MTKKTKKYSLEKDILEIAGEMAIKNITRGGNSVFLNLEELETLSEKEENKNTFGPFRETLEYLNQFERKEEKGKQVIELENNGKIILEDKKNYENDIIHLTKSQTIISKLKRKGIKYDFPKFLHFGPEIIKKGILKVDKEKTSEIILKLYNPFEGMNLKKFIEKNPEITEKLKKQKLEKYFLENKEIYELPITKAISIGTNLVYKALTMDVKIENNTIKKALEKNIAEKKTIYTYQIIVEPYKKKLEEIKTNKYITINSEELHELLGEKTYNNQVLKLENEYYKVKYELVEHTYKNKKTGRYYINENSPITLEKIIGNIDEKIKIPGFRPMNMEQLILFEHLIDPNIEMSIIDGGSGSGKTVVAYAAALQLILQDNENQKPKYDKIILFKSNDIIGGKDRDLGALPGTAFEKYRPFLKSFEDAHNLLGLNRGKRGILFRDMLADPIDELDMFGIRKKNNLYGMKLPRNNKAIEIEYLQYGRGRTFSNCIIFVDENQNYTPYEIKQLIERVGVNSKLFLVGDSEQQIDNIKLDKFFNGLTYAATVNAYNHPRFSMDRLYENFRCQSAEIMRNQKTIGK